jgi:uncharacterized caspase-like protein
MLLPLLIAIVIALGAAPAQAERRVALVIGNSTYEHFASVPTAAADATAIAGMLRKVNFDVIEGSNLDSTAMNAILLTFAEKADAAAVALFYYGGHAVTVGGQNYLVPGDVNLKSELDVKLGAIELNSVLAQMMSAANLKIVLLDASRENPFPSNLRPSIRPRGGLARMPDIENSIITFATAPDQIALDGKPGEHSPFAQALLDNLTAPGVEIGTALQKTRIDVQTKTGGRQIPWTVTNITGFYFLNPAADGDRPAAIQLSAGDIELETWREVRHSDNVEVLLDFLRRFPNSGFRAIARARIAELKAHAADPVRNMTATKGMEDALALTAADRRDVERRLAALDFYRGPADGAFTDDLRHAIRRWQKKRKYAPTGFLNKTQYDALLIEQLPARATDRPPVMPPHRPTFDKSPIFVAPIHDDTLRMDDLRRRGRVGQ